MMSSSNGGSSGDGNNSVVVSGGEDLSDFNYQYTHKDTGSLLLTNLTLNGGSSGISILDEWSLCPRIVRTYEWLMHSMNTNTSTTSRMFSSVGGSCDGDSNNNEMKINDYLYNPNGNGGSDSSKVVVPIIPDEVIALSPHLRLIQSLWHISNARMNKATDTSTLHHNITNTIKHINPLQVHMPSNMRYRIETMNTFWSFRLLVKQFKSILSQNSDKLMKNSFIFRSSGNGSGNSSGGDGSTRLQRYHTQLILAAEFVDLDNILKRSSWLRQKFKKFNSKSSSSDNNNDTTTTPSATPTNTYTNIEVEHYFELVHEFFAWRVQGQYLLLCGDWDGLDMMCSSVAKKHYKRMESRVILIHESYYGLGEVVARLDPLTCTPNNNHNNNNNTTSTTTSSTNNEFNIVESFLNLLESLRSHDAALQMLVDALGYNVSSRDKKLMEIRKSSGGGSDGDGSGYDGNDNIDKDKSDNNNTTLLATDSIHSKIGRRNSLSGMILKNKLKSTTNTTNTNTTTNTTTTTTTTTDNNDIDEDDNIENNWLAFIDFKKLKAAIRLVCVYVFINIYVYMCVFMIVILTVYMFYSILF